MNTLDWLEFEDIMDRFKWYPKPFTLLIFYKDKETRELFEEAIKEQNIDWKDTFSTEKHVIYQRDPYQNIEIYPLPSGSFCGKRANAVFINSTISIDDYYSIFAPLANISPYQGIYIYDEWSLKRMFELKNNHTANDSWEEYMLGLKKEEQ